MNAHFSPYHELPTSDWMDVTNRLVSEFPLNRQEIIAAVEGAWDEFYSSRIGSAGLLIGTDIFLPAQATGVILERLIAAHLAQHHDGWRGGTAKIEKDIICTKDPRFCFEVKTSSSKKGVYGNRSTGHRAESRTKYRSGYYLVVNYKNPSEESVERFLRLIRFGWIDDEDWVGQSSPAGQQASISQDVAHLKLLTLKTFVEE